MSPRNDELIRETSDLLRHPQNLDLVLRFDIKLCHGKFLAPSALFGSLLPWSNASL